MSNKRYNWPALFSQGERFTLVRGQDYHCSQSSIVQQLRNAASRAKITLHIEDLGDKVLVSKKVLTP
jgi:hypothetical protein